LAAAGSNNQAMGRRSRLVATRRNRRLDLEKSTYRHDLINLRAGAFCIFAAMLAENQGASSVVAWMNEYCYLTEKEAAESIAIGRRLMAQGRRNLSQ
jgi:hypothetical protein